MEIKLEKIPDYGHHMTLEHFIECCMDGGFIDYDGYGKYATATQMSNKSVYPSEITGRGEELNYETGEWKKIKVPIVIDRNFTHVVWFNK